ncbi:MAG: ParB/RepB/Spo0J family partition protein [Thermodesulfobacteriota bacterium]
MYDRIDRIDVRDIDISDEKFRVTRSRGSKALAESIAQIGLIHPPVVQETAAGYRIVSGFARAGACRQCGISRIDACIFAPSRQARTCLQTAIAENAHCRPLHVWEAAAAAVKLCAYYPDDEAVCRAAGPLGLPLSPALIEKYRRLLGSPETVQRAVAADTVSLPVALWLAGIDLDSADAAVELLETLRPTFNQQRQLIEGLHDLARHAEMPLQTLLKSSFVTEIVNDAEQDRKQKIEALRTAVHKHRYPHVSRAEERFYRVKKQLQLPAGVDFIAPKHFESPAYQLHIRFESAEALRRKTDAVAKITETPDFKALLDREIESS